MMRSDQPSYKIEFSHDPTNNSNIAINSSLKSSSPSKRFKGHSHEVMGISFA